MLRLGVEASDRKVSVADHEAVLEPEVNPSALLECAARGASILSVITKRLMIKTTY